ncbi:hypothetical protein [Streptomyces sp. NPDC059994]|uniref:hypothetical protein n=1 Tax=Streptomyces sp. NPDC059994 TaxID=3347029 RepID=UPI003696A5AF
MSKVYERTENSAICGNRWKFSKLAGDVCVQDRGHRGPHQNTRAREAHTFSWFDDEGIPSRSAVTTDEYEVSPDIETGFRGAPGRAQAENAVTELVADNPEMDGAYEVLEICPDHDEHPRRECEECASDA